MRESQYEWQEVGDYREREVIFDWTRECVCVSVHALELREKERERESWAT